MDIYKSPLKIRWFVQFSIIPLLGITHIYGKYAILKLLTLDYYNRGTSHIYMDFPFRIHSVVVYDYVCVRQYAQLLM